MATPLLRSTSWRSWLGRLLIVIGVGVLVYLPWLGTKPLDNSEGHRVVPGWTMLRTGRWAEMRLFDLTYLRKPPGMSWAVGASSAALGETVFAARLPSALAAIALGLVAMLFVSRWLGGVWGLAAGLAQLLMPLMWSPGRSAEIEMLNNLGTGLMVYGLLDAVLASSRNRERSQAWNPLGVVTAMLGMVVAAVSKGPASLNVLGGVALVIVMLAITRRTSVRALWTLAWAAAAALIVLLPLTLWVLRANAGDEVVGESLTEQFMWSSTRLLGVAVLIPAAFMSAGPISLAMLWTTSFLRRRPTFDDPQSVRVAGVCAVAWLASVVLLLLAGISNARYAMPAAVLFPPIAAAFLKSLDRRGLAVAVGVPIFAGLLAIAGGNLYLAARPTPDQLAGPIAAQTLSTNLTEGTIIWADDAIEARPDMLDLIEKHAAAGGRRVRVEWTKSELLSGRLPDKASTVLLLRTDERSGERARYDDAIRDGRLEAFGETAIRGYRFGLFRLAGPAS